MVEFLLRMEDLEMHSRYLHSCGTRREKREAMFRGGGGGGGQKTGASWSESSGSGEMTVTGSVVGGGGEGRGLACSSHGLISVIGRRRSMEDAVRVVPEAVMVGGSEPYDVFAVYDGHGGARVSIMCRERLHVLVAEEVERWGNTGDAWRLKDWEGVMAASFARMDEEVDDAGSGGSGAQTEKDVRPPIAVGSTAVLVLMGREEIVVANCGDSRVVLCRSGVDVPLSCDHKPDRPDEMERVEAAGGRVLNWNGSRVLGVLATSRSIGDHYLRPYVIAEPEVTVTKRTEEDEFLIIASDGLWDVVPNKLACELARRCLNGEIRRRSSGSGAAEAAAMLAEMAIARGSRDNISVIVVKLG